MAKIKLLLADEREIVCEALAKLLQAEPGIEKICVCHTGWEAVKRSIEHQPDVVLLGNELSDCSRTEAIQHIHQRLPKTAIIVLIHPDISRDFHSVVRAEAKGYICPEAKAENIAKAIILAAEGMTVISPPMSVRLLAESYFLEAHEHAVKWGGVITLSKREEAVLSLVGQGFTNREISNALFISEHTVKVHLRNIMVKLHVHTRQKAVSMVSRKNLLNSVAETGTKQM